ncbi:DUF6412 domain-containing protein [Nocardia amamiensis]|uniref:DUF6412 domain-containing protein n=1 Tax=Nocardia amamiensis TaxID=404578 RepID=UPI0034DD1811
MALPRSSVRQSRWFPAGRHRALCPLAAVSTRAVGAGPQRDEQRLRGAFRRQSAPDTPGRPHPRAPGRVPAAV